MISLTMAVMVVSRIAAKIFSFLPMFGFSFMTVQVVFMFIFSFGGWYSVL